MEPNTSPIFDGENVTFTCDMREGEEADWWYYIDQDGKNFVSKHHKNTYPFSASPIYSGEYQCTGVLKTDDRVRKHSNKVTLIVSLSPPSVTEPAPPSVSVPVEESSPVGLIVGLVVVILLTILLLLLCRYRTSKGPCCVRSTKSQGTNQNAAADQRTNQRASPDDGHTQLQHDEPAAESSDATYSRLELKYMGKEKKDEPAAESSDATYSRIELKYMGKEKKESSDATYSRLELKYMGKEKKEPDVTYAQVNYQNKQKNKKEPDVTYAQVNHQNKDQNKKAAPEKTEDTIYSQVKPGTSLG